MKILRLRVQNYKSIIDSMDLHLNEKLNILAGRNNSGKTALLEAIYKSANFQLATGNQNVDFKKATEIEMLISLNDLDQVSLFTFDEYDFENDIFSKFPEFLLVRLEFSNKMLRIIRVIEVDKEGSNLNEIVVRSNNGYKINHGPTYSLIKPRDYHIVFLDWLKNNIIFIGSNRSGEQSFTVQPNEQLDIFASNIHTVLYTIRNNSTEIFETIEKSFKLIFNEIRRIYTRIRLNQETNETNTNVFIEFDDNSVVPLQECGSGYTQVLIFLTVMEYQKGKVILFDEPHTFLHPYAEKAIYDLVASSDKHQYLFSTHSPLLVNYPVEKNIYFVKKVKAESKYSKIDTVQDILMDLGIVNSDFAFADKIIFVEGETEEKILPVVFDNNNFKQFGYNYKIINLKGTGDEFKRRGAMVNYSEKLEGIFNGIALTPIPYVILLDKDERPQSKVQELKVSYKGKIIVLPRREIENYFLIPEAIVDLINSYDIDKKATYDEVKSWIERFLNDIDNKRYYLNGCTESKINEIKASKVLEDICEMYTIPYNKIKDGLFLSKWLYQNGKADEINEVFGFFSNFLNNR
ncbi:AAA family ATPase [Bacillus sp. FJAT-29953]|nr:AAA family ATPase [Bacillus sp. FJAT-29953]